MASVHCLRDMLTSIARAPGHFASKSYTAVKAYGHHEPSTGRRRLRLKNIVVTLLCLKVDNSASCSQSSSPVSVKKEYRNGRLARTTATCVCWVKRKIGLTDSEDDGDEDEDSEKEDRFTPLLDSINLDNLTAYASSIRRLNNSSKNDQAMSFECRIGLCPMFGSFHILFPVIFDDGVEWLLKVPAAGHSGCWDDSAARGLKSEAMTMKFLKEKTTIPVPAVYGFGSSLDSPFRCPFILMERIDGRPLYEKWYNGFTSPEMQEEFRERSLRSIAAAMVQLQLSTFQYGQLGAPILDQDATLQIVEPVRVYDAIAVHKAMISETRSSEPLFCDIGPYNTVTDYYLSLLETHFPHTDSIGKGIQDLLGMFVKWTYHNSPSDNTFILCHPDFNLQNILVAEDGTLKGLIDWDGVSTVPQPIGCPFPKWLTLDWDPANYNYQYDVDDCCRLARHHSPREMRHYRARYIHFVQEAASKAETSMLSNVNIADATRKSVLAGSLDQAVRDPLSTAEVVVGIFNKISHITSQKSFKICDGVREIATKEDSVDIVKEGKIDSTTNVLSSSDGTSDHSDSCFSDTSGASSQSTASTDRSLEKDQKPDNHQVIPNITLDTIQQPSDLPISSTQHYAKPEMAPSLEKRGVVQNGRKIEIWHRVPSLLQRASTCLRSNENRLRNTKSRRTGTSEVLVEVEELRSDVVKPTTAVLASSISEMSQDCVHPSDVEATRRSKVGSCRIASENAPVPEDRDLDLSSSQPIRGKGKQGEQETSILPFNGPSTSRMRRKYDLRQRVNAKLARNKTRTTKEPQVSSPNLSENSEAMRCGPAPISSERNRIITWLEKITHKLPKYNDNDTAVTLHSVLPEIPLGSQFHVPDLENPDSSISSVDMKATSNSLNETSETVIHGSEGDAGDLALHHINEPVNDAKLREEGFLLYQICDALMDGTLDDRHMQRLQQGFAALLDSL